MSANMAALAGPVHWKITTSVVLDVLLTACHVAQGIFIVQWLNIVLIREPGDSGASWLIAFGVAAVLRGILAWASEVSAQATAQATKSYLRRRLLDKLYALGPGYAAERPAGEFQAVIVNGVEAIEGHFSRFFPAVASGVLGCVGVLLIIGLADWQTAMLLLIFLVSQPLIDRAWMRWRMPKLSGIFRASAAFGAYLLDNLQGLATLKVFDASGRRRAELANRAQQLRREAMPKISVTMARIAMTGLFTFGGVAIVLAMNSWRVASGTLAPVTLLLTLFLAREVFRPLERLEKEFHTAQAAKGALKPILDLLNAAPAVVETAAPLPRPDSATIAFDHVCFAYAADAQFALRDISFTVPQGAMVAIVGPSGAGKSTLLSLLLRFIEPQAGRMRIGGTDIADLSLDDLRSLVTMVSQDVQLFHGSIGDNLRIARQDASDTDIIAAAHAAHIDDFISSLADGYDSEVGERGARLSGGQRQRIAIARALLKDAPILLLDEASSNLDPADEGAIRAAIDAVAGDRTTLVIAHRLSTVMRADLIIVMEDGRIVEQGRHQELLGARGLYHRLVAAQELTA